MDTIDAFAFADSTYYQIKSSQMTVSFTEEYANQPGNRYARISVYDDNLNFIGEFTYTQTTSMKISFPVNAKYYRVNFNFHDYKVANKVMIAYGDKPLPYTPYNSKEHITNPQAYLLESEEKRSRNLCNVGSYSFNNTGIDGNPVQIASKLSDIIPDAKAGDYLYLTFEEINVYTAEFYLAGSSFDWYNGYAKTITEEDLNNAVYVYGISNEQCTYKNIMVSKNRPLAYEPYAGQIIHKTDLLEALKLYGEMPAITSIAFNTSDWENIVNNQNFSELVTSTKNISQFTTNTTYSGYFKGPTVYPLKASNSISKCEITRVSGSDKLAYTASVNTNTGEIKLTCTARTYEGPKYPTIYGMGYSSGSYPTEESTFKLEVGDIYGNSFTFTFTVRFKYAAS